MTTDEPTGKRTLKQRLGSVRTSHKKRKSPSGLKFVLADSIDFIPAKAWDSLTANASFFLSRQYLKVLEEAGADNISGRYAMAFSNGCPVLAMATQLLEINGRKLLNEQEAAIPHDTISRKIVGLAQRAGSNARQKALAKIKGRLLVCGNLFSWGQHAVAFAPGFSSDLHWGAVAEGLYRIRRAEKLSGQTDLVMIKDFTIAEESGITELKDYDYRPLETDPNMVLEIPESWQSFDDYLNSLASKYRSGARKIVRDVEEAGIQLKLMSDLRHSADRIHALYMMVHSKASVRLVTLSPDYLPTLANSAGSNFRCTVAWQGSEIVGFITSVKDGDTSIGYYIGFDYSVNEHCPLYFRLLQVCIDDAIAFGCRRVSYGRTALDPKARMGARPVPTTVWMRHRLPVLNWLVRGLLHTVPHDEAPDRNPFKK